MTREPSPRSFEAKHYFDQLEANIVQRMHLEAATPNARAELVRSTGVKDENLIDELSRLGITSNELIALRLFPLVLVAWAEDHADSNERKAVRLEAERLGIQQDSTAWMLLDTWLRTQPPGIGVDAWRRYTHNVFSNLSPKAIERLIALTERQMTSVAEASGGHFGFGKVSKKERTMIKRLIATMRKEATLN